MEEEDPGKVAPADLQESRNRKSYKNPSIYNFNCECGRNFNLKKHFNAHRRKVHNEPNTTITKPLKHCPLCDFSAKFRDEMIKHIEIIHNIPIVEEKYTFRSQDEFLLWKREMESNTNSKFINKGTQIFSKHRTTIFQCHRSGCYATRGKGLRSLKSQGSVKMNSFCPSRMIQKCLNNGTYNIHFSGTHVGHQNEIKHLTLTRNEKGELAKKISSKIPFDDILDQIRNSINDCSSQRIHLLTRKDLYNIEAAYKLQAEAVRHKYDAVSIDVWVSEMQSQDNCVLFYKPQDIFLEDHPNLKSEDFVLIIMTGTQLDILKKYGNDCVCCDSTHGLNSYDLELNTLIVLDELREAFPCAFLISNRPDTEVLALFFEMIRDHLQEQLKPKVFMSDLADTFFNAWVSMMGIPEKRLFCTWHVDRAWRMNLNKIKSPDTQLLIYKNLRTLTTVHDQNSFKEMLQEFCCISDVECAAFIKYFQEYHASNYEYWAYCYHLQAGIHTNMNMHLERMHQSLKYIYSKGKTVKRLDKRIATIMHFIKNKLINRVNVNHQGKISSRIANIRSQHNIMEKMDPSKLISSGVGWEVLSEDCQELYQIQKHETNCRNCQMVCSDCSICIHQFQCSCSDSVIKYNMCKHIHLVAKSIRDSQILRNADATEENSDSPMITDSNSEENHESVIRELSKNVPVCQDVDKLKEELRTAILETLSTISSVDEIQVMEKIFDRVGPSLAAIRDKKLSSLLE